MMVDSRKIAVSILRDSARLLFEVNMQREGYIQLTINNKTDSKKAIIDKLKSFHKSDRYLLLNPSQDILEIFYILGIKVNLFLTNNSSRLCEDIYIYQDIIDQVFTLSNVLQDQFIPYLATTTSVEIVDLGVFPMKGKSPTRKETILCLNPLSSLSCKDIAILSDISNIIPIDYRGVKTPKDNYTFNCFLDRFVKNRNVNILSYPILDFLTISRSYKYFIYIGDSYDFPIDLYIAKQNRCQIITINTPFYKWLDGSNYFHTVAEVEKFLLEESKIN